jgi:hypothetical protein
MALSDRDRSRLRNVMDTLMRADDAVMDITDERAIGGPTPEDAQLDALHESLSQAVDLLERLLGGKR